MSDERQTGRPTAGAVEERSAGGVGVEGRRVHGVVPYGVQSSDMGGWREQIEPGALRSTDFSRLKVVIDHQDRGLPLARYPASLELSEQEDGLHWNFAPPESRADVREALERGDVAGSSWRMRVARDHWVGDVRHVDEIAELRDLTLAASSDPVYPTTVEYRSRPAEGQEDTMSETAQPATRPDDQDQRNQDEDRAEGAQEASEQRPRPAGSLRVEQRSEGGAGRRGLAEEFRSRGFPAEPAEVTWDEYRTLTVSAGVSDVDQSQQPGVPLGYDERFAFPAFPSVAVDAGVTSVNVLRQTGRSLATAADVVRAVEAVTDKPETSSTVDDVVTAMKQVASIQTGVPNIFLEQPAIVSVIEQDLRNAVNSGLDKLVLDAIATAGFQAPGSDNLVVSIRKSITTIQAAGHNPNLLVLTPAAAESLDTLVSGISGGSADFVFAPGQFAPTIFGLQRRISKTIPASAVVDAAAFGRLYASPLRLQRFEADAGTTNTSNIRLELNACFGLERVAAAVRIAAS